MAFSQIPDENNDSIMRVTKRNLALCFGFLLLLLGINAAVSYFNTQRLIENNRLVNHTYQVIFELETRLAAASEVVSGTRGYVITGQESFLEPFNAGVENLSDNSQKLLALLRDNTAQTARVSQLEKRLKRRIDISRSHIALRRTQGQKAAERAISTGEGKRAMDAIRATVSEMKDAEFTLLNLRQQESAHSANAALLSIGIFTLSGVLLLSLIYSNFARAELRKAELQHAYARLKKLENMRDSLTAMIVHDLRTPLTTLLGPLELLESGGFGAMDETQTEILNMSTRSGYRLLGLVNELLDISKMEAGEMKVRRETVQVHVVVNGAVDQVLRVDQAENGRIERQAPDDLPLMQADEDLLIRVLINLLGNALKFTPNDSKVTICAREAHTDEAEIQTAYRNTSNYQKSTKDTKPSDDASQKHAPVILFSIQDRGEGIPIEDQNRIFEKFGQVESRQEGHKMSTGLGLTFCKLAVEAHGGHIWVRSEIGQGSTFFFTVPLRPWVDTDDKKELAQAAAATL